MKNTVATFALCLLIYLFFQSSFMPFHWENVQHKPDALVGLNGSGKIDAIHISNLPVNTGPTGPAGATGPTGDTKRRETYSGTTNGSGVYTITYSTSFGSTPNVQASFIGTNPRDNLLITASSTTGFSVLVQRRVDVVGLLPTYTNQSGVSVNVLVTEN